MGSNTLHSQFDEYTRYAEIRQLAYTIASLQQQKKFYSLAVLSCLEGEGKTLLCAALAIAYAETCHTKVLIVDTTSVRRRDSIQLKECFNGSTPNVLWRSLDEIRRRPALPAAREAVQASAAVEPSIVPEIPRSARIVKESDFSVIRNVTEDYSKDYGLILIDTMPLHARNKGNIDPLLVARQAGASVLVVSRASLENPKLSSSLKLLRDSSLNLIGVIGNEARAL